MVQEVKDLIADAQMDPLVKMQALLTVATSEHARMVQKRVKSCGRRSRRCLLEISKISAALRRSVTVEIGKIHAEQKALDLE